MGCMLETAATGRPSYADRLYRKAPVAFWECAGRRSLALFRTVQYGIHDEGGSGWQGRYSAEWECGHSFVRYESPLAYECSKMGCFRAGFTESFAILCKYRMGGMFPEGGGGFFSRCLLFWEDAARQLAGSCRVDLQCYRRFAYGSLGRS